MEKSNMPPTIKHVITFVSEIVKRISDEKRQQKPRQRNILQITADMSK